MNRSGNRVSVYDPKGELLRLWGRSGSGEGEFDCPGGLAVEVCDQVVCRPADGHSEQGGVDRLRDAVAAAGAVVHGVQHGQPGILGRVMGVQAAQTGGPAGHHQRPDDELALDRADELMGDAPADQRIEQRPVGFTGGDQQDR